MTYRWQSLYYKIILAFTLVILIPLITLAAYNIAIIRENAIQLTGQQTLHRLREQRAILQGQLEGVREDIRFLSALPQCANLLVEIIKVPF